MTIAEQAEMRTAGKDCAGQDCTLEGCPARVVGRLERFATVRTNDGRFSAVYAWETVARVMGKGGNFKL